MIDENEIIPMIAKTSADEEATEKYPTNDVTRKKSARRP
jgi:hypothetical protein